MPESNIRRRVIFRGRVQGVGFRYTVHAIARGFPVTGYVRNLPDRSVELIVDADDVTFDQFLAEIQRAFTGNIGGVEITSIAPGEEFTRFEIRHG